MSLETMPAGSTIYNLGDLGGDKYYVVLSGQVQVSIPDPKNPDAHIIAKQKAQEELEALENKEDPIVKGE